MAIADRTPTADLLDELRWRGLLHQATDEAGVREHLRSGVRRAYVGFDPTADSLTIGNLVPIMMLAHFGRAATAAGEHHQPVVVMGGGTGLIGDPSGKSAERTLMTRETVEGNVRAQRPIFANVFAHAGVAMPPVLNNIDWLGGLGYLEALRDIGKHFSVNMMIQKDSVRERLHARDQGISYTEFSYMILQAYDFAHLFRHEGVTVQMGGSDQWGNIVAGCDLIRRMYWWDPVNAEADRVRQDEGKPAGSVVGFTAPVSEPSAFGVTAPLVTKADGGKFGKTETGAVWLTKERTSPYAFYQFWLNAADEDVERFLKIFTFLPQDQIAALMESHRANPGAREAQRTLARNVTEMIHGRAEREGAEAAAAALFSGDVRSLSRELLDEALGAAPSTTHSKSQLAEPGLPLLDLLPQTSIATSKSQARQLLSEGSISVNGLKAAADARVTVGTLLHGSVIALRRGKKTWHVTRWE